MDFYSLFVSVASSTFGSSSEETRSQAKIEQDLDNLRIRNQERMAKIRESMGAKWILHPSHMKSKLDMPRPV